MLTACDGRGTQRSVTPSDIVVTSSDMSVTGKALSNIYRGEALCLRLGTYSQATPPESLPSANGFPNDDAQSPINRG